MTHIVEIGTISSRGQIAIPAEVRRRLSLTDGGKVMFVMDGDSVIIKKVDTQRTWEEVTRPFREAMKNSDFREEDVVDLVHRVRKKRNESNTRH